MDDYNRGGHSKYSMNVHLIFVTKYRKQIFKSDKRADDVKQFCMMRSRNMDISQEIIEKYIQNQG